MGCSTDKNRASVGLFVSTLMQVLQKWATKAAKCAREQKLQAVLTLLAVFTLLSLLVRGGRKETQAHIFNEPWTECEKLNRSLTVLFMSKPKHGKEKKCLWKK